MSRNGGKHLFMCGYVSPAPVDDTAPGECPCLSQALRLLSHSLGWQPAQHPPLTAPPPTISAVLPARLFLVSALPSVPCCVLLRSSPSPWLCVAQRWYQHRGVSCAPLRPFPFHSLCVCFFPPFLFLLFSPELPPAQSAFCTASQAQQVLFLPKRFLFFPVVSGWPG